MKPISIGSELHKETFRGVDSGRDTYTGVRNAGKQHTAEIEDRQKLAKAIISLRETISCADGKSNKSR